MTTQLTLRLLSANGNYDCEKYDYFPSTKSTHIAIAYTKSNKAKQYALDLKQAIVQALQELEPKFIKLLGCPGAKNQGLHSCGALNIPSNSKILILVSDGKNHDFSDQTIYQWKHQSLPVYPAGKDVKLKAPFDKPNAAFWKKNIGEVIWSIFNLIGVNQEDQKVFISYKRSDSTKLADQLFNSLIQEGFEVFLDRFSINPGVNFQNLLYQALYDKAMVLFLESKNFLNSQWVQNEISFSKTNRLGYLAINIDGAPKSPAIKDKNRRVYYLNKSKKLNIADLNKLTADIKHQHLLKLHWRKKYVNKNIEAFARKNNFNPIKTDEDFIKVQGRNQKEFYLIGFPRPVNLKNYYFVDNKHNAKKRILISSDFMEPSRSTLNQWLSGKSGLKFYNEGDFIKLKSLINS